MENILHYFNEKIISLTEKYLKKLIFTKGISSFTDDLVKEFAEFGSNLTQFIIEYAEKEIFELKERKEEFESLEKDKRNIVSIFGEIEFKRRYYKNKETSKKVYLLDEFIGIEPKQRLLENVRERLITEAIETTYENAGNKAAYGVKISRQEVKNEIEKLDLDKEFYNKKEKVKQVENLYIIADEDHVHLQKGGIEEPRIVIVYENAVSNGKRIELNNKRHFGGIYKNKIHDLWDEVSLYIEENYDLNVLKNVFIQGDGATWIKTGLEWVQKSVYVLDEFHMTKAINGIVGRITKENKKEQVEYKKRIYNSIKKLDFKEFKDICYEILSEEMEYTLRVRKEQNMNYILNNEEGIRNLYNNKNLLHGCSAEGHVSHVFSDRMSSRPMGWKTANVNNMSKLRLLREDKITVKEIMVKQEKVININEYKEIKEKTKKKINKNIDFKPVSLPIITFGTHGERDFFRKLLDGKAV
jgi:hypothetical protein